MHCKGFCCNFSIRIAYKWHHSHLRPCISQTGTTQTTNARDKGGNFIGQLCISVVPHWNAYINDSTRARCYILYGNVRFQPYLNLIHIETNRVLLSYFRVSAHRLEVETGKMKQTRSNNFK